MCANKMADSADIYENPLNLPLEQLNFTIDKTNVCEREVKAIDMHWVQPLDYPRYAAIPVAKTKEVVAEWLMMARSYIVMLQFFVGLPFHKFWSYASFEPRFPAFLESFLRDSFACYNAEPDYVFLEHFNVIYILVFNIYGRLLTAEESPDKHISPQAMATILRKNSLITNSSLWNIARIFGHSNSRLLPGMISFACQIMPHLDDDLEASLPYLNNIFTAVTIATYRIEPGNEDRAIRAVHLFYDTVFSINMYLHVHPPFRDMCIKTKFYCKLVFAFDAVIPLLCNTLGHLRMPEDHFPFVLVGNARIELVQAVRLLLTHCLDLILQHQGEVDQQQQWVATYLDIVEAALDKPIFLTDFDNLFPISEDIDLLLDACPYVNQARCERINGVVHVLKNLLIFKLPNEDVNGLPPIFEPGWDDDDDDVGSPECMIPAKVALVQNLFPELRKGFVKRCLKIYKMDSDRLIYALLQDALPGHLAERSSRVNNAQQLKRKRIRRRRQANTLQTNGEKEAEPSARLEDIHSIVAGPTGTLPKRTQTVGFSDSVRNGIPSEHTVSNGTEPEASVPEPRPKSEITPLRDPPPKTVQPKGIQAHSDVPPARGPPLGYTRTIVAQSPPKDVHQNNAQSEAAQSTDSTPSNLSELCARPKAKCNITEYTESDGQDKIVVPKEGIENTHKCVQSKYTRLKRGPKEANKSHAK